MDHMKKRTSIALLVLVGAAAVAAYTTRSSWTGGNTNAQAPQRARIVAVEIAKAERKPVPVDVDSIGTVTPISSVALKSRVETTITSVHFEDGAKVKEGDLLFTLDSRQIDAQIEQAEGTLARDQAQLAGAERDVRRFTDLIGKGATTQVSVDNAKTQSDILAGTIRADQSALDNLKVQKSYTIIRAPFSGRIRSMCPSPFRSVCLAICAKRWRRDRPRSLRPSRTAAVLKPARWRWWKTLWIPPPAWSLCAAS
jgi:multidrug efflux pump subunit AcrA (membrane-fusion protein)